MLHVTPAWENILLSCVALILILVIPVWDYAYTKQWKRSTDPEKKIRLYRWTLGWLWLTTAFACFLVSPKFLYRIHVESTGWIGNLKGPFVLGFGAGALGGLLVGTGMYVLRARKNAAVRGRMQKRLGAASMYLPGTQRERRWFVVVAFTAGICEEFLYRGFLIHYLSGQTWHLGLWTSLLIACGAFGLGHIYQGVMGVLQTAVLGLLFGVVFVVAGSLLVPIVLHILIDLRILLLLPQNNQDSASSLSSEAH